MTKPAEKREGPSIKRVREAKQFLAAKNITARMVSPRTFAAASSSMQMEFGSLLRMISRLLDGGQNMGPITLDILRQRRR